jgi:hypothetical protein
MTRQANVEGPTCVRLDDGRTHGASSTHSRCARQKETVMIRDTQGRKWYMRFKQYRQGWQWDACHDGCGFDSGEQLFPTRALAEDHARSFLRRWDHVAWRKVYTRLLLLRGSECSLTPEDHEAIRQAASV